MGSMLGQAMNPSPVLCIVLGGGASKGLFPLTRDRATPAVPLAGTYRLVDVPLSNCINSGFRRIYVLTQFNSVSLHRHVSDAYKFDQFSDGFVEIRAAQQTFTDASWYQGTADAVRKNLAHFVTRDFEYALILSADQLYRQDFRALLAQHITNNADVTIATALVPRSETPHLGILQVDGTCRVQQFVEKPTDPAVVEQLRLAHHPRLAAQENAPDDSFLASMGIYVFNRVALQELLDNALMDFGHDIIPRAIKTHRVFAYLFQGFWADLGAIRPFFEAHLDLASDRPRFNFLDTSAPIFSQPAYLPGAKINGADVEQALFGAGCIITHASIKQSIIGPRCIVGPGSRLDRVVCFGSDYYETEESIAEHERLGLPRIGIGRNSRIDNAIIDRNARIGDNVTISPAGKPPVMDGDTYYIRDGIVVIPRNGIVPHGTVIGPG
jgi:glucose-1-phosphate adenylyltransferase